MINILVADDHEIFIEGLRTSLSGDPDICIKNTAINGCEVIKELKKSDYDIVLLDVNMPKMDGIDCARKINKSQINTKIIILSQYGDKKLVERLMKYNIDGYLLKSSGKEEIIKAIKDVYQNRKYFANELSANPPSRNYKKSRFDYFKCDFSVQEKQVLKLICAGKFNSEIAKEMDISKFSVETYRQRIMVKSGMRNTAELVKWVVENDFVE